LKTTATNFWEGSFRTMIQGLKNIKKPAIVSAKANVYPCFANKGKIDSIPGFLLKFNPMNMM